MEDSSSSSSEETASSSLSGGMPESGNGIGLLIRSRHQECRAGSNPAASANNGGCHGVAVTGLENQGGVKSQEFDPSTRRHHIKATRKKQLLGMPFGTAKARLVRKILFQLVQETRRDICWRCNERIERLEDFSIEHKDAWQVATNPKDAFFDLDNISYSHFLCNCKHGNTVIQNRKFNPNHQLGRETMAKLTKEQATEVKRLLSLDTMSQRAIARMYGLHHSSIQAIANGASWQDA